MKTIACHTLGCKVNQYDTQAMLEQFERAGYQSVDFHADADVYLINTCTVTGTGDQKSLKLIRRTHREHPDAALIVCGCLAQRDAARVMLPGVKLVLGVKHRSQVVELLARALSSSAVLCAVEQGGEWAFECLSVERHEGKTRAIMKIQEGCDRYCAYCVIPYVRGPVRSMPLEMVGREAARLADAGKREIVLTGIHLLSYGRELGCTLSDAIAQVQQVPGVSRIRLGSLEPVIVTQDWIARVKQLDKVCPQFHLSMQSGSAGVLSRMRRRYTPGEYRNAAALLKAAFADCAITTDVLTGFPGETDEEALETERFVREIGFARIHVFPYSRRSGTVADRMPGQVPESVKQLRAARLIEIGNQLEAQFVERLTGSVQRVLFETALADDMAEGYSRGYVRVRAHARPGEEADVRITGCAGNVLLGVPVQHEEA
ncbi:MAG: tRNA (N(6)-L-threonylcarbamoyladenosine(37)-C(2))-methylthiotransferase MtaB [Clostridia bacterium]